MRKAVLLLLAVQLLPLCATAEEIVRSIHVDGLERTNIRTVLRELPFTEGDVWQDEWKATAERWIRNTGLFSEARVSAPNADGVVEIYVHEKWSLWLLPTVTRKDNGASKAGLTLDEYNLWGLGHKLHASVIQNTGKNFSASQGTTYGLGYDWRRIADSKWGLNLSLGSGPSPFDAYQNGVAVAQYIQEENNAGLSISYAFGPVPGEGWGASLGYNMSNTSYRFVSGIPQPDIQGQKGRSVALGISYTQVDDKITWFTGTAFAYSLSVSHKSLGSSNNSYAQTLSFRTYAPINGENTFNTRLNAGLATGGIQRAALFDLGNRNAIRGYYPGEIQGTRYVYGTAEWRYLISPGSNVQLAAFSDIGYVSNKGGHPYGKTLIVGAGAGVRWTLRWLVNGTVRGDAAYGVATHRWRFYLGSGQAF